MTLTTRLWGHLIPKYLRMGGINISFYHCHLHISAQARTHRGHDSSWWEGQLTACENIHYTCPIEDHLPGSGSGKTIFMVICCWSQQIKRWKICLFFIAVGKSQKALLAAACGTKGEKISIMTNSIIKCKSNEIGMEFRVFHSSFHLLLLLIPWIIIIDIGSQSAW